MDQENSTDPANAATCRLCAITLDEKTIRRSTPDIDHEREVAIYDLIEDNFFAPVDQPDGPYKLVLSIREARLVLEIRTEDETVLMTHLLSLSPFRKIIRDYLMICESYYEAIRSASPRQIEAIDMGRRGLHNEGSDVLKARLDGKIEIDFGTARRLFTLICVLHWKG